MRRRLKPFFTAAECLLLRRASYNQSLAFKTKHPMTHDIKTHLADLMRAALNSVVPDQANADIVLELSLIHI